MGNILISDIWAGNYRTDKQHSRHETYRIP